MKDLKHYFTFLLTSITVVVIFASSLSCTQYDYSSPLPGVLEVRLKTISTKIAFSPLNNFVLQVKSIQAIRSNLTNVVIYADPRAKERKPSNYNTLDSLARDSIRIMGQTYVPPGDYIGVDVDVRPGSQVVLNGYQQIGVVTPEGFQSLLHFRRPFSVSESALTTINLTINLDSSLVQGSDTYSFRPYYYISNIQ